MGTPTFIFAVHALDHNRAIQKVEEGVMPTFESLMDGGVHGITRSVFSTSSPVDYTSMLTGTTHTTHGIDDFQTGTREGFDFHRNPEGEANVFHPAEVDGSRLYTSYDVEVPWVWELLEEQRAMQFGVFSPTTYPAPKLPNGGVWVSGYWSKPTTYLRDNIAACNDQDILQRLLEAYPDYHITPLFTIPPLYPDGAETEMDHHRAHLEHAKEISRKLQEARFEIFRDEDWDVFLTEEGLCDNVQHLLWPRSEDNPAFDPDIDPKLREEALLDQYYAHVDEMLAMYLEELPDDANVVVISAHGHQEAEDDFYMHDRFKKLYEYGIWDVPEGWEFRAEKPDWSPPTRSEHSYDGLYIAKGPDFSDSGASDPISCMDVTPLLLHLYGETVPQHIDGTIPEHLIHDA